ncbi:hypothetical protein [Kitasatospora phosalacinea]|uniref:Tail assembly chaperone n=1 Tax=Kitasatospora phosalacinea TaxID=2065 RepID=A0A9W6PFD3_9ACTN|nr:hypothetical protein [Kitasatospora phosalacinea]GLW53974.1 hypothetical protein Kpho01_19850 [Kitasatospora phosalacinea]
MSLDDDLDLDQVDHFAGVSVDVADFDAFFAEQRQSGSGGVPLRLYGRTYRLPKSMPLLFSLQMERLQHSENPDDVRMILRTLVGEDALDHWAENGMDDREFGIVLIWSAANVRSPGSVSMQRAAALYDEQSAAKARGKAAPAPAPNRAARRKKPKKKGRAASGRPS